MAKSSVVAFLPCRAKSERVLNKNTRPFAAGGESLLSLKVRQLRSVPTIDQVVVSTNDSTVIEFVESLEDSRVMVDERPDNLCLSTTPLDALIKHAGSLLAGDYLLWTHVTSPFLDSNFYDDAIAIFFDGLQQGFDSVVTVRKEFDFFLFEGRPLNFGEESTYWPRTQDVEPVVRITSGLFLLSNEVLVETQNRIGRKPYFLQTNLLQSIDVDTEEDFHVASLLAKSGKIEGFTAL